MYIRIKDTNQIEDIISIFENEIDNLDMDKLDLINELGNIISQLKTYKEN